MGLAQGLISDSILILTPDFFPAPSKTLHNVELFSIYALYVFGKQFSLLRKYFFLLEIFAFV